MKMTTKLLPLIVAAVFAAACNKKVEAPAAEPPKPAEPAPAPAPAQPPPPVTPPTEATPPPAAAEKPASNTNSKAPAALLEPGKLTEKAPAKYKAKFSTTKGDFVIEVHRDWAPLGADRFYNLVKNGFFDNTKFFRVIKGFMVQWGIHGEPAVNAAWREARIKDDPPKESNRRGYITFATAGPDTRTTQVFINFVDNGRLDSMGFSPFGKIVSGQNVVDSLYSEYGEGAPGGAGPSQPRMQDEGNSYLERDFPKLDAIKSAKIVK
jgi:peptidyl-prolyl cis-trans isomerase A (cyclophilin A)